MRVVFDAAARAAAAAAQATADAATPTPPSGAGDLTPPTQGVPETAPAGLRVGRQVFGSYSLQASIADPATLTIEVEQTEGGDDYETILEVRQAAGLLDANANAFAFTVRPGCRWRWSATFDAGSGGNAAITRLAYSDA